MSASRERSGILSNLLELERDFKYNLKLLRIRDSEIERCGKANRDLREALKVCLRVKDKLISDVTALEHALAESEREKSQQKRTQQASVDALTETLNEMRRNQDVEAQKRESEIRCRTAQLERSYAETLNKKQSEFSRDVGEIGARLQKEMILVAKMKQQLKDLSDENMDVRNKLRELNARCASETSFYKSELDALRSDNEETKIRASRLEEEIENRRTENRRIGALNGELESKLNEKTARVEGLIRANGERENDNRELNALYVECRRANDELNTRVRRVCEERDRLRDDVEKMKANANASSSQMRREGSGERKYETMSKQNVVLQEIVKSMRREREAFAKQDAVDVRCEMRIEKMEGIIEQLKQNATKTNEIES